MAKQRFEAGHYVDASEAVFKEVANVLKQKHRRRPGEELDGVDLTRKAFSTGYVVAREFWPKLSQACWSDRILSSGFFLPPFLIPVRLSFLRVCQAPNFLL